jgi:hypothetical protein
MTLSLQPRALDIAGTRDCLQHRWLHHRRCSRQGTFVFFLQTLLAEADAGESNTAAQSDHFNDAHKIIGLTILICCLLQGLLGIIADKVRRVTYIL